MKKKTGFQVRDIAGEKVVVAFGLENIDFCKMISLNASAYTIWEIIDQNEDIDVDHLADLVIIAYKAMKTYDEEVKTDGIDVEKLRDVVVKTVENYTTAIGKIDIEKFTETIKRIYENYPESRDDEKEMPLVKEQVTKDIANLLEAWKNEGLLEE